MSAEAAGIGATLKWAWGLVFAPVIGWIVKENRSFNTRLTRLETREEATMKSIDENTEATKDLTKVVTQLRIDLGPTERTLKKRDD